MKLINPRNKNIILEFDEDKTVIYNSSLKEAMETNGIVIPSYLIPTYQQEIVKLGDLMFQKAFRDIYFPQVFSHCIWED
jgi:MoaA/NifB/PqqE/SkfB family radical SAM enzyme